MTTKAKVILVVTVLMAAIAGVVGFVGGRYWIDNRTPNFSQDYVLYVYPDMTVGQVMDSLYAGAGTVRPKSVERAFRKMEVEQNIKPGRYVVEPSSTSIYVARMLVFGWQTPQNLTLSGTIRSKGRLAQKASYSFLKRSKISFTDAVQYI